MEMKPHELVQENDDTFLVHTSAYTDPLVFDLEMWRIFESNWIFVAHESQIPEIGDYITTQIGVQPVIVCRADDGQVHVLLNRCRHRGSVICRTERGHASKFQCPYHSWVYANDGTLGGRAQESAYPLSDGAKQGLASAAQVGIYRGLIFASLNPPQITLDERLRAVADYIDLWVERSPLGQILTTTHAHKMLYDGNWKFQMENGNDGYHGNYVHESFMRVADRAGDTTIAAFKKSRNTGTVALYPLSIARRGTILCNRLYKAMHRCYRKSTLPTYGIDRRQEAARQVAFGARQTKYCRRSEEGRAQSGIKHWRLEL